MTLKPAAIFWDMDGTLTDSEPLWEKATFELSERLGKRITPEQRAQTVGSSFTFTLGLCADNAGYVLQPGDFEKYREFMFSRVGELFEKHLDTFPGIRELLCDLQSLDIPMMLTTNTEREVADFAIDAIGRHFFVDTLCGDEVPQQKPAPDMYLMAAETVGAPPSECLVFEDSYAGMTAAVEAGCRVIGLPAGPEVDVPEGVVPVSTVYSNTHLEGANAGDVLRWFNDHRFAPTV